VYTPAIVGVNVIVPTFLAAVPAAFATAKAYTAPVLVAVIPLTAAASLVKVADDVTTVLFGLVNTYVEPIVVPPASDARLSATRISAVIACPTADGVAVVVATVGAVATALLVKSISAAAFAGTTDNSPNPSEATATADTFFNEIVFTIFLSFSQIKDDLLPGW
jgi:hypothetical protein